MNPIIFFVIVISIFFKAVQYENKKAEQVLVNQAGRRVFSELKPPSFAEECIIIVLTWGVIIFFVWGVVSLYLGCEKNSDLSTIRERGTRITGQVVKSEMNEEYSAASVIMYTYYVDFEINGEKKRSATMSSACLSVGKTIDIFYLPHSSKEIGGIAVSDVIDESPGKVKIYGGIVELFAAFLLFWIRFIVKKRQMQNRIKRNGLSEAAQLENLQNQSFFAKIRNGDKYAIRLLIAIVFFVAAMLSFSMGIYNNIAVSTIRKHGVKTTAIIIKNKQQETYYRGAVLQEEYLVEFLVNGEKRKGKAVSKEIFLLNKEVEIFYPADAKGEVIDVVFADVKDYPGRNKIFYGILELLMAIGFYLDYLNKTDWQLRRKMKQK